MENISGEARNVIEGSGTFPLARVSVHRLGYGTMQLTGRGIWGPPRDPAAAVKVLRRAVELGVDLFDTADSYGPYVAEELLREALHPYASHLVIATKAGLVRTGPGEWHAVGRPEYLRQECEMSLRRLGVECIDLFQLHRIDPKVPAAEQFGALKELQDAGKVRQVGLSEVGVAEIEAALGVLPIATVQNRYNLIDRQSEAVLDFCTARQIGFIPWFPIASGALGRAAGGSRQAGQEAARPSGELDQVAAEVGASPAQVALAWLLRRSPIMLPIPGTSSVAHLEENCAAAAVELSDSQVARLSGAS
jgi:pyridoxine 4-dehydrogenase